MDDYFLNSLLDQPVQYLPEATDFIDNGLDNYYMDIRADNCNASHNISFDSSIRTDCSYSAATCFHSVFSHPLPAASSSNEILSSSSLLESVDNHNIHFMSADVGKSSSNLKLLAEGRNNERISSDSSDSGNDSSFSPNEIASDPSIEELGLKNVTTNDRFNSSIDNSSNCSVLLDRMPPHYVFSGPVTVAPSKKVLPRVESTNSNETVCNSLNNINFASENINNPVLQVSSFPEKGNISQPRFYLLQRTLNDQKTPSLVRPILPKVGVHKKDGLSAVKNQCFQPVLTRRLIANENLVAIKQAEEFEKKKQERRVRNRISSLRSRMRKKNEEDNMRRDLFEKNAKIELLEEQCRRNAIFISELQSQNLFLKQKVCELEKEMESLKESKRNVDSKHNSITLKTFAFFVFLFIAGFQFSPIILSSTPLKYEEVGTDLSEVNPPINRYRRKILSTNLDSNKYLESNVDFNGDSAYNISKTGENPCVDNSSYFGDLKFINQTEAFRLNKDVKEWEDRHISLHFLQIQRTFRVPAHKFLKKSSIQKHVSLKIKKTKKSSLNQSNGRLQIRTTSDKRREAGLKAARERAWRHIDMISSTPDTYFERTDFSRSNQLNDDAVSNSIIPKNIELQYMELLKTLKQREDTLYFVAMKDYYLVPALNRSMMERPRLTLILPALYYNGTLPNQIAMMRLECEVNAASLFHIAEALMPLFQHQPF